MHKFTGYEKHKSFLASFNKEKYLNMDDEEKSKTIDIIFKIYREVGIYPVTQFTEDGIIEEIVKCREKVIPENSEISKLRLNQGGAVCRYLFPNLRDVMQGGDKRTLNAKFNDDHMLKRAIEFCLKYKNSKSPVLPSGLKDGLEMMGGGVATNFKPMNAKALYERYCPEGGRVLDYSAGFGGRMLGCLSSDKNYHYVGIEPNSGTFSNLETLGNYVKKAFPEATYDLYKGCSEDIIPTLQGSFDFAFSSPPYFHLEHYCDEDTQSHLKFPELGSWLEGYVKPTVQGIYDKLNPEKLFAVNIADYNYKGKRFEIVEEWIRLSEKVGFTFLGTEDNLNLQSRRGVGHSDNSYNTKKEGIYLFRK